MPTTLTNGIQLPDKGSVDWYNSMQSNYNLIDTHLGDTDTHVTAEDKANWNSKQGSLSQAQLDAIAQVATNTDDIATLQSGKANASHTHSSSDITDIGDYATKDYVDNSISGLVDNAPDALNTLNELSAALNDDSNFATTVTNALSAKANSADLATVATSGDYDDLSNKPSIPTNTSDLNNDSGFVTLNDFDIPSKTSDLTNDSGFITSSDVPTSTSDLINDSNFVDTSNSAVASGITAAKVTSYDSHIADTDIHVTTADKNKWNNGVSQSYVLRYSSASVTDNSIIAFSTLDNTDNIKSGDKVIDSDGKIFSIVSVDTANSTVTVGSALIDLALDANVVHTSGNETVGGIKTFDSNTLIYNSDATATTPNLYLRSSKIEISSQGNTSGDQNLTYLDKNNTSYAYVKGAIQSNGSAIKIRTIAKDSSDNSVVNELQLLAYTNGNKAIFPSYSNEVDLGASSYKWKSVFATNYYYGNDNVEFSTKFVTTDTAQIVSGGKTFSSPTRIYNANASVQTDVPNLVFKNPLVERASTTLEGEQTILFTDKNDNNIASIQAKTYTSGISDIILTSYSEYNGVRTTGIMIRRTPTTSKFQAYSDNITTLGESNRRWKSVYAMSYYYGNDNVEFSTKFVTTDTNQTISGTKTFTDLLIYNSDTTAYASYLNLKNQRNTRGSSETGVQGIQYQDKNGKTLTMLESRVISNGNTGFNIICYNTDGNNQSVSDGVSVIKSPTETIFAPTTDNAVTCGRPLAKWSNVQTYKVNALEPSSLSLPDLNNGIDISSYITTGDTDNNYTPSVNGWIWIRLIGNGASITQGDFGANSSYVTNNLTNEKWVETNLFVTKNVQATIRCRGITGIVSAKFYPCQGNV